MVRPKVSVIIPVYLVSAYVERCVRSVMEQSYTDIECIIVDDETDDDSIEKCEALISKYGGPILFRILHHEQNRGLSAARNTGTAAATGDYLYYLDSDDYIAPDCIERLVSVVDKDPTIEMVQGNCIIESVGKASPLGKVKQPVCISNNDEARTAFYNDRNIYISVWNRLLKKSFVEKYDLYCREGLVCEDLLWVFYLIKHLNKAYLCEEVTYHYMLRSGSILTNNKPESMRAYTVIFDEIFHNLTVEREQEEIKGFLWYFIKRYVSYVKKVPEFKDTIRLYKSKAWQFHCSKVYIALSITIIMGQLGNPKGVLEWLNALRWKWKMAEGRSLMCDIVKTVRTKLGLEKQ